MSLRSELLKQKSEDRERKFRKELQQALGLASAIFESEIRRRESADPQWWLPILLRSVQINYN